MQTHVADVSITKRCQGYHNNNLIETVNMVFRVVGPTPNAASHSQAADTLTCFIGYNFWICRFGLIS